MRILYLVSVWLHILAATVWIGGMAFLVLVVVPWLRQGNRSQAGAFLRETGMRFRTVGWVCFAVLIVTGSINLWLRGVGLSDLANPVWLRSPFGHTLLAKIGIFAAVLVISGVHDFRVGPDATRALERDPHSLEAQRLRRAASHMGRANAVLALVIVALAVMLVRGTP